MIYNPYFDGRRPQQREDPEDMEYPEVDQHGKRFRKIGNCIEYEPEINGLPRSTFFASQKAQKKADEERRKREVAEQAAAQTGRDCPFKIGRNNVKCSCEKSCAFYLDTACAFARMDTPATKDTKDMGCVIARRCYERCAMYNHGCTLIDIVKGMKPGKE